MSDPFSIFYAAFIVALWLGQGRVVIRDFSKREAGWGRFTYGRTASPGKYWLMVGIDILLFLFVSWFFVGAVWMLTQ